MTTTSTKKSTPTTAGTGTPFVSTISGDMTLLPADTTYNGAMLFTGPETEDVQVILAVRNCLQKNTKHTPHPWVSHLIKHKNGKTQATPHKDVPNAFCDGTGRNPEYTTTSTYAYTSPVKKDYLKTWRQEYTTPITVEEARAIAYDMHSKQKDKIGDPYWMHLQEVCANTITFGGGYVEQIIALFHDAVEDFHTTYDILRGIGVTEECITGIEAVSKRTSEEQNLYLQRIIDAGRSAMIVKLSDLMHNTRADRMARIKDEYTRNRLKKKYLPSIARLMLELGMIMDTEGQKKLATTPVGSSYSTYSTTPAKKSTTPTAGQSKGSSSASTSWGEIPKPVNYALASLMLGDWPKDWPAPILIPKCWKDTEKHSFFLLCNGEYVQVAKNNEKGSASTVAAWSMTQWKADERVTPWDIKDDEHILKEDLISLWITDLEEQRAANNGTWKPEKTDGPEALFDVTHHKDGSVSIAGETFTAEEWLEVCGDLENP